MTPAMGQRDGTFHHVGGHADRNLNRSALCRHAYDFSVAKAEPRRVLGVDIEIVRLPPPLHESFDVVHPAVVREGLAAAHELHVVAVLELPGEAGLEAFRQSHELGGGEVDLTVVSDDTSRQEIAG